MEPLDGLVLAGGRSRRLGVDKGLVRFGGVPLLRIVVERVAEVCREIAVAVDRPGRYEGLALPARIVADESPGLGPLSGLQVGLRTCRTEHVLVAACDLPFLNVELLRHMAKVPRVYQALVPWQEGRWQPLHAIYARSCLEVVDAMAAAGGASMEELLGRLNVRRLDEEEMSGPDQDGLSLLNLNDRSDLRRARGLWRRLRGQEAARK
jgi:molybdopterin-guanine dinucleotide biosynthesis protein A